MPRAAILLLVLGGSQAFLFGSSGGCGCQQSCAPPPPPPVCAPPPAPVCPPSPCGGAGYSAPLSAPSYAPLPGPSYAPPAPVGGYATARGKRDTEQAFDPKCNSEALKNIIIKNIHENTAMAKRQIQAAAANEIGGRVDVICSKGTFSYIVNTEVYCETAVDGTTCFAFRQSN